MDFDRIIEVAAGVLVSTVVTGIFFAMLGVEDSKGLARLIFRTIDPNE